MVKTGDIPYGYVTFDGRAMSNYAVDAYNYMSNRIEVDGITLWQAISWRGKSHDQRRIDARN